MIYFITKIILILLYQLNNPVKTVPPRKTLYRYKQIIRDYFQINEYTDEITSTLQKEANNLANNFIHRKKIFYTLVNLSKKLNIEVPSYTELTRIIQVALNTQKKDILEKLEPLQDDERLKILDEFLEKEKDSKNRFIPTVQTAKNSSFRAQKDFSFELEPKKNQVMQSLEDANISVLNEIAAIVKDEKLSAVKKVAAIEILVEKKTQILKNILHEKKVFDTVVENKYDFIEKKSVSLQGRLSGILKAIEFDEETSNKHIIAAIKHFKDTSNITIKAPKEFLSAEEKTAVYESGKFRVSLYKALLFFHVSDDIKNGTLNLKYSLKYRNFEDYLIDKNEWKNNKDTLLKVHELEDLKDYDKFIEPIKEKLEKSFKQTNENIKKGFNTYFTATEDSYILKTPKLYKQEDEESIAKYFPANEYISVIDLLLSLIHISEPTRRS